MFVTEIQMRLPSTNTPIITFQSFLFYYFYGWEQVWPYFVISKDKYL